MKKPEPLDIDGERFEVIDNRLDPNFACAFVGYHHGGLSPFEVEQLRDWLTSFLDWYYQNSKGE